MTTTDIPRMTSTKTKNKLGDTRGLHLNSLANLRPVPFLPGNNGGPGRPVSDGARAKLEEICPFDPQGRPWKEALSEALLRQALTKTDGMREALDRIEGPVLNKTAIVGDILVEVVFRPLPQLTNKGAYGNGDQI